MEESPKAGTLAQRFDAYSSALSVLQGRHLSNKYAIVTGANSGIGRLFIILKKFRMDWDLPIVGCIPIFIILKKFRMYWDLPTVGCIPILLFASSIQ